MCDVVTLGEAMIRLSPPDYMRLEQTRKFNVSIEGSELDTAVSLSRLGLKTSWITKLPRNPLGRMIVNRAREHEVDTSNIVWTNEGRVGVYYLELGSSPRASQVIYDRKNSAVSQLKPGEVDWSKALKGAKLFHVSGITASLSKSCAETTYEAVREAKKQGCKISFDINYRAKLWPPEEAKKCLSDLLSEVDILITTQFDANEVFDFKGSYEDIAKELKNSFGCSIVVITLREVKTVLTGGWSSIALADKLYKGKNYNVEIIDRVGAGDAYTAGFIYGYLTGDIKKAISYGDALASLEQTIPGGLGWFAEEDIKRQIKKTDFRIQR